MKRSNILKISQHDDLIRVYEEVKGNVWHFVNLYKLSIAAGMGTPEVTNLLKIVNNDLSIVRSRFDALSRDVISLELQKQNSMKVLQELNDQITASRERVEYNRMFSEEIMAEMDQLYQKKVKLEELIRHIEHNSETYLTTKKNVEDKIFGILSNRKMLLKLALISLIGSMGNNLNKYNSSLSISTTEYISKYCWPYIHRKSSSHLEDNEIILAMTEEADRIFKIFVNELRKKSITTTASNITPSSYQ